MSDRNPEVDARCPACHGKTLFLGDGGHITCSWVDCPEPGAAGRVLDQVQAVQRSAQFVENLDAIVRLFRGFDKGGV